MLRFETRAPLQRYFIFSFRLKLFSPLSTDADNEMITFSSDEELVEALGSFNGDVFRVYVKDLQVDCEQDAAQFVGGYTTSIIFKIVIRVKFALYRL